MAKKWNETSITSSIGTFTKITINKTSTQQFRTSRKGSYVSEIERFLLVAKSIFVCQRILQDLS
jgi:hypothetical protein